MEGLLVLESSFGVSQIIIQKDDPAKNRFVRIWLEGGLETNTQGIKDLHCARNQRGRL